MYIFYFLLFLGQFTADLKSVPFNEIWYLVKQRSYLMKKSTKRAVVVNSLALGALIVPLLPNLMRLQMAPPAGPDPITGEASLSLNGSWKFNSDPTSIGEANSWFATAFN